MVLSGRRPRRWNFERSSIQNSSGNIVRQETKTQDRAVFESSVRIAPRLAGSAAAAVKLHIAAGKILARQRDDVDHAPNAFSP